MSTPSAARLLFTTDPIGPFVLAALLAPCLLPWGAALHGSEAPDETGTRPLADAVRALTWIDSLYRDGDLFRAESEILRFTHDFPRHPRRSEVDLLRAKLYYQDERYGEASLILYSLLDRFPSEAGSVPAAHLLGLSLVHEGRLDEAVAPLRFSGFDEGRLAELARLNDPPPGVADPQRAVTWSTWLPGSGFFILDQPGKAVSALSLNLAFTVGAVLAYQQENLGAALVLLLVELALYSGGRDAVRQEGERLRQRAVAERRGSWLREAGETELLGIGFSFRFGGSPSRAPDSWANGIN